MSESFIDKVGFEIEGGWAGEKGVSPFPDISLIADHSINGQTLRGAPLDAPHVGEAISLPIPYQEDWRSWLESHWPNAEPPNRTNETCGFHIHISVKSKKAYTLLTSKLFLYQLREAVLARGKETELPKGHNFWKRVNGNNTFCHLDFSAARQMDIKVKDGIQRARYGWLNFAAGVHGTVEFRALPTFRDADIGIKFAETYFSTVDAYLATNISKTLRLERTF